MKTLVEFHGVLRRLAGADSMQIELPDAATAADALEKVSSLSADLAQRLECCACAIGDELIPRTAVLEEGVTLVLIPPVSGG